MLTDIIKPENVILNLESDEKDVLFAEMVENIVRTRSGINRQEVLAAITEREQKMNTCIKEGIAVPHACCKSIIEPVVVIGISKNGVDYDVTGDNNSPVHLVIMILFEEGNPERHLHILAECANVLQTPEFYKAALVATSVQDVLDKIKDIEEL